MPADVDLGAIPARQRVGLQNPLRRALRHYPALVQQQDAVGPQRGEVKIVQHDADVQLLLAGQLF